MYDGLQLDTETIIRAGITNVLDRSHDAFGRATGFSVAGVGDPGYSVSYGYDSFGRFNQVSNFQSQVSYAYLPASDLISSISNVQSQIHTTKSYEDHRDLLTQVKNSVDSTTLSQYDYGNDAGGRRTSVKQSGTAFDVGPAFNAYGYNARSEVTSAARYWGADLGDTSEPVDGQSYAYAYDNIGNRTSSSRGTNAMTYTANGLNQYTQRTVPDGIDVLGSAETNTTVTVNNLATTRFAKYWYRALTGTNSSAADYHAVNVVGVYNPPGTNDPDIVTSATGHVFVAQTPEAFTYDDDGNLLSDGRFNYSWDAENRLIAAETLTNLPASVPRKKVEFAYDYMSRRVGKTVSSWDSGTTNWTEFSDSSFLYDSWNLLSEICDSQSEITTNWWCWGLDLSGSLQGAGGIGGLLCNLRSDVSNSCVFFTHDANGNVSDLVDTNGAIAAHYEYSPFGETIVATGPLAKENKFRFSTKYTDDEVAMLYYGYRYYKSSLGRWPSRDPIGESGGENLYLMCDNSMVFMFDPLGHDANNGTPNVPNRPMTLDQTIAWLGNQGFKIDEDEKTQLWRGCIGICTILQGKDNRGNLFEKDKYSDPPENYKGARETLCYLSENEARNAVCPGGSVNFVFSKQGAWKDGIPLPKTTGNNPYIGIIPNDSIISKIDPDTGRGWFNYVCIFSSGGNDMYITASSGVPSARRTGKPQRFIIKQSQTKTTPEMWCSSCIKPRKAGGGR